MLQDRMVLEDTFQRRIGTVRVCSNLLFQCGKGLGLLPASSHKKLACLRSRIHKCHQSLAHCAIGLRSAVSAPASPSPLIPQWFSECAKQRWCCRCISLHALTMVEAGSVVITDTPLPERLLRIMAPSRYSAKLSAECVISRKEETSRGTFLRSKLEVKELASSAQYASCCRPHDHTSVCNATCCLPQCCVASSSISLIFSSTSVRTMQRIL